LSYPLGSNARVMKPRTRPSATINRSVVGKLNALSFRIRADERQRRLNIIIGAASPLERWGLRSMLEAEKDFHIIGEAGNGHEALGMVREEEPDVVMFDVMMPYLHGIEIARRIAEERLVSRTVVLSNFTDRPIVEAAVNAGVHGFVHKPGVETELRSATASLNDVLRLTDATTPFIASLASLNTVNIYFNVATFEEGQFFTGAFFTDAQSDFLDEIVGASFNYYVADAAGTIEYNGVNYAALGEGLALEVSTVNANGADFAGGSVNGQITQFEVVPEPSTYALLILAAAGFGAHVWRKRRRA